MSADLTTVYRGGIFVTMEPDQPEAEAVAVRGGRIVGVGTVQAVTAPLPQGSFVFDDRFADHTVLPGFIDQHLHPILGATTLMTEVIATEEWVLPGRTFAAAMTPEEFLTRLTWADHALADPDEWLFSWGYHRLWHGPLDRGVLDAISSSRPIAVWQRSCHEWFLNSAAIARLGITQADGTGHGAADDQVDFAAGHWWENGFFTVLLPKLGPVFLTPTRITAGLKQLIGYLHQHGVTAFNEPGIVWEQEPFELYEQLLGAEDTPFLSTFMVECRSQAEAGMDPAAAVAEASRQIARASAGKVSLLDKQVKLFADGAIISQLMQMIDPYLDQDGRPDPGHRGEWLMPPEVLQAFASAYWDAGWQLHTHVNGDRGLQVLLETLEQCQLANPRDDHRSVVVHFATSTEEQVERIARLGAIVSANPYYVSGFADKFGAWGLGPDRADVMVRNASVLARGIPLSFHSDLPMAASDPLLLASCAVNRITQSGRVAAPEQRISVQDALRAITIEAAYSWRKEDELGSIAVGKIANFTVLADNPFHVDPTNLHRIPIVGTMFQGRWFPIPHRAAVSTPGVALAATTCKATPIVPPTQGGDTCGCVAARRIAAAANQAWRAA